MPISTVGCSGPALASLALRRMRSKAIGVTVPLVGCLAHDRRADCDGAWPPGGTAPRDNATVRSSRQLPRSGERCQGQTQRSPPCVVPWEAASMVRGWLRCLLTGRARHVMLAGQLYSTVVERSTLGQCMTWVSRPLGTRWEKKGAGRERCHTEGGAPAKQDGGSPVVRNRSEAPRQRPHPWSVDSWSPLCAEYTGEHRNLREENARDIPLRPSLAQN